MSKNIKNTVLSGLLTVSSLAGVGVSTLRAAQPVFAQDQGVESISDEAEVSPVYLAGGSYEVGNHLPGGLYTIDFVGGAGSYEVSNDSAELSEETKDGDDLLDLNEGDVLTLDEGSFFALTPEDGQEVSQDDVDNALDGEGALALMPEDLYNSLFSNDEEADESDEVVVDDDDAESGQESDNADQPSDENQGDDVEDDEEVREVFSNAILSIRKAVAEDASADEDEEVSDDVEESEEVAENDESAPVEDVDGDDTDSLIEEDLVEDKEEDVGVSDEADEEADEVEEVEDDETSIELTEHGQAFELSGSVEIDHEAITPEDGVEIRVKAPGVSFDEAEVVITNILGEDISRDFSEVEYLEESDELLIKSTDNFVMSLLTNDAYGTLQFEISGLTLEEGQTESEISYVAVSGESELSSNSVFVSSDLAEADLDEKEESSEEPGLKTGINPSRNIATLAGTGLAAVGALAFGIFKKRK